MFVIRHLLLVPLLLFGTLLLAQTRTITGKVFSGKDNAAISAASITLKGSSKGVFASSDGSFSITVPTGRVVLSVTSIGFAPKK